MGIHYLNWIVRDILVIKLSGFAEILTPSPLVSFIQRQICYTICHHKYDVICGIVCRHV